MWQSLAFQNPFRDRVSVAATAEVVVTGGKVRERENSVKGVFYFSYLRRKARRYASFSSFTPRAEAIALTVAIRGDTIPPVRIR